MKDLAPNVVTGPLERGRRKYQQKEYQAALAPFTEAVDMSTGHLLLTALDHRAAAYEKLKQFQPALRDAKRMIETKPDSSKGYLRCGKILQLKGEDELALKIYERGLTKVKIGTDNDRTLLQTMFNKVRRALNPSKSLDPLQYLPLEIAEMICHNLAVRERVVCLAVSKPWKRLLESSPKLWTTLDTTYAKKNVSLSSLKAYTKRSNYKLDRAILSNRCLVEVRGSTMIGESLKASLPFAQSLESIVLSKNTIIGINSAQQALECCRTTLTHVKFLHLKGSRLAGAGTWPMLPKLKSLCLKAEGDYLLDVSELAKATSGVMSVALKGWRLQNIHGIEDWTALQDLDLSNTEFSLLPMLPATLRRLILRDSRQLEGFNIPEGKTLSLPLLETFDCAGTPLDSFWVNEVLEASIKHGKLRVLSIGNRLVHEPGHMSAAQWAEEFPLSLTLRELSLAASLLDEAGLMRVVQGYPHLRVLDVSYTNVTGVAVKRFVKSGIKHLKLDECNHISLDAIDWARSQGAHVDFNFAQRPNIRTFRDAFV
ncbi:RNI-like protein [Glarea lozoyensis ATCC 20868]|uniref:RNI-like protein n=1 Tax=Glarea lozoyensis (strain ATCC 20868 / MF5171) TaxID=1116229 RepID=S3CSN4_GLAL2|nr:RNI-like protein [Glarea lozoyensis ATCC 20868]EPE29442.1 RNI-like protein [Glarea lozoyensis ATCC 20868]